MRLLARFAYADPAETDWDAVLAAGELDVWRTHLVEGTIMPFRVRVTKVMGHGDLVAVVVPRVTDRELRLRIDTLFLALGGSDA